MLLAARHAEPQQRAVVLFTARDAHTGPTCAITITPVTPDTSALSCSADTAPDPGPGSEADPCTTVTRKLSAQCMRCISGQSMHR